MEEEFEQFLTWLEALDSSNLVSLYEDFYNPLYLNLLSVFGDELPAERIRELAAGGTKFRVRINRELLHYARRLPMVNSSGAKLAPQQMQLQGWDTGLIKSLLGLGKGLIICSHHIGPYRFIPLELVVRLGLKVWLPLNETSFAQMSQIRAEILSHADVKDPHAPAHRLQNLKLLNVEGQTGPVSLAKALRRGEVVFFYVDGNTGSDGAWGGSARSVIKFLRFTISVKSGAARLAAAFGAPILPLLAIREGNCFGRVILGDPITPDPGLRRQSAEEFSANTMQRLYSFLEPHALRHPEQWEGCSYLHRWRVLNKPDRPPDHERIDRDRAEVARLFEIGKSLRINERRVAIFHSRDRLILVDVKTMRSYANPMDEALAALLSEGGLGPRSIEKLDAHQRDLILSRLAYLKGLGLICEANNP